MIITMMVPYGLDARFGSKAKVIRFKANGRSHPVKQTLIADFFS
jgi:hypothetical protein